MLPEWKIDQPKDYKWNEKRVRNAVAQGIIQGESVEEVGDRLTGELATSNATKMDMFARTAINGAQNAGRMDRLHEAEEMGIEVRKKWLATLDQRTRDTHQALDGQEQPIDEPFVVDGMKIDYPGDPLAPPELVYNCFVGETSAYTNCEIERSYCHEYKGELIEIETSCGVKFTCTPNHPILTLGGWVSAASLHNGDDLLVTKVGNRLGFGRNCNVKHVLSCMKTFHDSFKGSGLVSRNSTLSVNFHGDIPTSEVEIITKKRFLPDNRNPGISERIKKFLFELPYKAFACKCSFMKHLWRIGFSTFSFICGKCKSFPLFWGRFGHSQKHGLRPIALFNPGGVQPLNDNVAGNIQIISNCLNGFTGIVLADNIISVNKCSGRAHVYNLQTENGYYFVNTIITKSVGKRNGFAAISHNCRCTLTYVYPKYQHLQHNHERRDQLNDKNIENMTYYEWLGLASKNDRKQEEPEPEEPSVGRKIVQGKDITETWERRPDQFKFEIDDVINAQGFDGFPQVLSRAEFDAAVKAANGGKGFIAQRTYSAPDQAVLDAYRAQLYGGKWYVDCSVGTAAYGQGMYATGDFNGQITENMQKATDFYIGLNEQKGNSVAATEVFTLQADAKIADYEKLYSEFTKYGMETQEKNAEIRRTAVKDASKELADKILKDAGFEEEYAKKFFYGNLSIADVDWEEMGKAYKQLGSEGVKKMQELQSEYYKKQTAYVDEYVKEKSIDEIKDIGAFATALGYDAIEVKNHGIYDTTEVVVLNRTKCIFLDPASKEEPKQTEEAMPDLPTQPSNPSKSKDASFVETEEKEKVKCPYTDEMSSNGYVGLSAAESDEFIKNHHNKRIVGKKGSNTMDGSQSRRINTAFRNDETPTNPADVKLVQKLDAEINKNELPQDMTLFRGVSLDAFSASGVFDGFKKTVVEMSDFKDASGNIDFDKWGKAYEEATDKDLEDKLSRAKKLIGTTIEDKGYMQVSASSQRNIFAASEIGLQIHAPKGTNAYISDYQGESEIILGRGTSYRVLDATIATTTLENGNQIKNIQLIVETVDETESEQKSEKSQEEQKSVEEKKEKESTDVSYQYHATTAKAIIGIAEKGLQPNRGHVGKGIYFADNAKDALDWVDTTSTGGKTVLRVSEEYLEKEKLEKYSASETGYGLAESLYDGKIPLEHIQIKVNDNGEEDDWWSLAQYLKNRKSQYNMLDSKTKKKVDKLVDEEDERRLKRRR